jgi:hypothetical protein
MGGNDRAEATWFRLIISGVLVLLAAATFATVLQVAQGGYWGLGVMLLLWVVLGFEVFRRMAL